MILPKIKWSGNFKSWEEAQEKSDGYDNSLIFEKVCKATNSVLSKKACFERDSVIFHNPKYNYQLLTCLLYIATKEQNKLNILDFGGSLGSSYFQHRKLLNEVSSVKWNIVEQSHFVEFGKKNIHYEELDFYNSIEDCLNATTPNTIIFSSVLPYLKNPRSILKDTIYLNTFKYIIVDRTGFVFDRDDRLTIQKVPRRINKSSYPCWFFNRDSFDMLFSGLYKKIMEFNAMGNANIKSSYKGMLYERLD